VAGRFPFQAIPTLIGRLVKVRRRGFQPLIPEMYKEIIEIRRAIMANILFYLLPAIEPSWSFLSNSLSLFLLFPGFFLFHPGIIAP
jgi:hypothetical protein